MTVRQLFSKLNRPWIVSLVLFAIALGPRLSAAGAYVTVDEQRWIERSVDMMYNLSHGDLATITSLHPGVTATWGFGLALVIRFLLAGDLSALFQMRADNYYDLPDLLPTAAIFTVLVTSITVAVSYLWLRKLLGTRTAILVCLLLALDPNLLAHSRRVHVDALLASFMYLSALALFVHVGSSDPPFPRRYLVASGILAGLAWLTKLPAIFLVPFTLLALAGRYVFSVGGLRFVRAELWQASKGFLVWIALACLVFFALWPSMWMQPGTVLSELVRVSFWGVDEAHRAAADGTAMQFFMGKPVGNPGLGYYPLISLFRMAPITFLFWPLGFFPLIIGQKRKSIPNRRALVVWLGAAYVAFYVVMLSLGAKKLESYVLPIFPMVDTLAAVGLVVALDWLVGWWSRRRSAPQPVLATHTALFGLTVAVIMLSSFPWLRLAPYYSTYFNPLLGGVPVATRVFVFGGGEGLDMAAEYLNQKENARDLTVASPYYDSVFRYYFVGTAARPSQRHWGGSWFSSDYVIDYFSYTQRNLPNLETVEFLKTLSPEYVSNINGTDYARVYKVPSVLAAEVPADSRPVNANLGGKVTLRGYELETTQVESGGEIEVTLYWEAREPLATDYSVYLRLVNGAQHIWGAQDGGPVLGLMPTSLWREGEVVADSRRLQVWPGTPPGEYQIAVGMYDSVTMDDLEPLGWDGQLLLGPVDVVRGLVGGPPVPQHSIPANLNGEIRLLGHDLDGRIKPGESIHLTLFWQALVSPKDDYTVFVHVVDRDGTILGQKDSQPVTGFYATSRWTEGEYVRDQVDIPLPAEMLPGEYRLVVGMYRAETGQRLPVRAEDAKAASDSIHLGLIQVGEP